MVESFVGYRAGAVLVALAALPVLADAPRLVALPFTAAEGVPDKAAARLSALVLDELRTREELELVAAKVPRAAKGADATAAFAQGKKALAELRLEEAIASHRKGIDAALGEGAGADWRAIHDANIAIAVAYFRLGEEDKAQAALLDVTRLDPTYKLEGAYPPVFVRELEKARKKVEKLGRAPLQIEGPAGATAYVDGRSLGTVPAQESVTVGTHHVALEGARGERFAESVKVEASGAKVKGTFGAAPPELRVGPVLDSEVASKLELVGRAAKADFVLVGIVRRSGDRGLVAAPALYSVKKQGFQTLAPRQFNAELAAAGAEVFKIAEEVAARATGFGTPGAMPIDLIASSEVDPDDVDVSGPRRSGRQGPRKSALEPRSSAVEEDEEAGAVSSRQRDASPQVSSPRPWVWVLVGVGVVAGAGAAYYGVTEAARPGSATVTARWP